MGDGTPKGCIGRLFRIHVNKLVIIGGISKLVDALLGDLQPG